MAVDEENGSPAHRATPLAPLPEHRNVNTGWWQELWRRHAHITTPLRQRGLTCDIEFGLSAYIVRVTLPDDSWLIISPPQEPPSDRPPGDPEGWLVTRHRESERSRLYERIYDSAPPPYPSREPEPEARHGGSAGPLIAAIDQHLDHLGLLPNTGRLRTFDITQDGTLSFTLQARDLADAHARVADLESTEATADTVLAGGVHLTHITYGSVHDSDVTVGRNTAPRLSTAAPAATVGGDAILQLTDELNGSSSSAQAAALLHQVLEPSDGLLARLADFFEAAAEKAKEAEDDDGFDLSYEFADAAAEVRNLGEVLQTAESQMRSLAPPPQAPRPLPSSSGRPPLPPPPRPTAPPRHTR